MRYQKLLFRDQELAPKKLLTDYGIRADQEVERKVYDYGYGDGCGSDLAWSSMYGPDKDRLHWFWLEICLKTDDNCFRIVQ